ncbi:NAD(P)H-binding protein [Cereibacter sp. SYSU M97828]|nr:NAD(P)H-binding protein [Cereibacter flavus]
MRDILVTGGTGTTGSKVMQALTAAGIAHRTGTRRPAAAGDVAFDWADPAIAAGALGAAEAVYIVAPTDRSDHGRVMIPVLEEALANGLRRCVLLSSSMLEPGGPMMGEVHAWIAANAPEWAVLRPSWFMQNLMTQHRRSIAQDRAIFTATGRGRCGFIDASDIADVAVAALTADTGWNRDCILTGPQALNYDEVASSLTARLGFTVGHVALSEDDCADRWRAQGMDDGYARALAAMDRRIAEGAEDRVTDAVAQLAGHPPVTLQQFIDRNRHVWKDAPMKGQRHEGNL